MFCEMRYLLSVDDKYLSVENPDFAPLFYLGDAGNLRGCLRENGSGKTFTDRLASFFQ